jgi:hypothetical protein
MTIDNGNIDVRLLQAQFAKLKEESERQDRLPGGGGGNDTHMPDMNERMGRLEGEIGGLKHSQNMLLGGIGLVGGLVAVVAAFVIGFGVYTLQKIDTVNEKVGALPGQIQTELLDISKTLAANISAAKQQPPQVILVPTPQPNNPK